ncbi:GTP-binding protein GEM-like [Saccoglossus kowalevskii]
MTIKARPRSASEPFLSIKNLVPFTPPPTRNVYLLGDSGVGKSSIAMQFVSASYLMDLSDFDFSISEDADDVYDKTFRVDDDEATVRLFDTPPCGHESFEKNEDKYLKDGDAYLLVYSVTSRRSFQRANELRFKLRKAKDTETVPIILVGNKTDLERSREVSFEEGRHFAASFNCKFIETSASLGHNIDEVFEGVVRQIRLRTQKSDELAGKSKESPQKRRNSKRRRSSVLKRARGLIGRFFGKRHSDPSPSYRSRSKSCHNLEIL